MSTVQHVITYGLNGHPTGPLNADAVELWEETGDTRRCLVELVSPEPGAWHWTGGIWYDAAPEHLRRNEWSSFTRALHTIATARYGPDTH